MNGWIVNLFVVLLYFKVWKDCVAAIRVRHYSTASIDQPAVEKHFEDIPDWLHKCDIHGFIIVAEINPPTKSFHNFLPFSGVTHHNVTTFLVVVLYSHLQDLSLVLNSKLFVDFILHWKTMAIPPKTTGDKVASLRSVSANHILDCSSCNVAIMRSASGEGWSIIKCIWWQMRSFS